jgi:hypothetical protein
MQRRLEVSEREMAALIKAGKPAEGPLNFAFGPGWAALTFEDTEPLPPSVYRLGFLRGVCNLDGTRKQEGAI